MGERVRAVESWIVRRVWSRSRERWAGCILGIDAENPSRTIETSPIASVDGRIVTTRSGSRYELRGPARWPQFHPGATENNPMGTCEEGYGFYLATDGDEIWPPGATVTDFSRKENWHAR